MLPLPYARVVKQRGAGKRVIRVDILDSCPIYLYGLQQVLEAVATIRIISARTTPADHFDWLVDVSLVDPDALGSDRLEQYIGALSQINRVLVLVSQGDAAFVEAMLRYGASGVVNRSEQPARIIAAIHTLAAGEIWADRPEGAPPVSTPDAENAAKPVVSLSEREEQVLRQISRGLTHGQIASRLGISPHTVDTYVKRIRSKLGVGNKAELTRAAVLGNFCLP